jgi:serine/threonine-protein kinase
VSTPAEETGGRPTGEISSPALLATDPPPQEPADASGLEGPPLACPACERPVAELSARFCAACGHRFASPSLERIEERSTAADPLVGRTLADRYRIEEVIGRGGMGVVYRIEHTRIGKAMAMKLLHGDLARDREVVRRFRREAETVSKLDHPNTVQIFDFGQSEGMTFLVMELLGGEDLGLILHVEGTIPFARIAHIATQVCGSVQQAHDRGIVHRDLKPENIRILHDRATLDFAKVLDFGLAKLRENTDLGGASITRQGLLVGTPYYMAPEQIRGERSDHRADVYAMGCVLYKSVVGVPPFWASTPVGVLTKHITDDPVPPSVRSPRRDVHPDIDRIVLRAMAKDPAERQGSMRELREELEAYLRDHPDELDSAPRRSLVPEPDAVSAHELTQPLPALRKAPPRQVVAATRDEVERYERRLRAQSLAMWTTAGTLALAAGGAGYYGWVHRPIDAAVTETSESEPNDEPGQADVLHAEVPLEGQIGRRIDESHGDVDVYDFEVPPGADAVALRVSALPNIDLAVDVFLAGRPDPILVLDAMPLGAPEAVPNLPLEPGLYFARVHEVRVAGRFPIENVSDHYSISWSVAPRGPHDELEWNDSTNQAESVTLERGVAERVGFIGWNGDIDTFCVVVGPEPLRAELSAIQSLDLVLESIVDGRESTANEHGRGESEAIVVPASSTERRVCLRVSAGAGSQRGDASAPYTLRLASGASNDDAP